MHVCQENKSLLLFRLDPTDNDVVLEDVVGKRLHYLFEDLVNLGLLLQGLADLLDTHLGRIRRRRRQRRRKCA